MTKFHKVSDEELREAGFDPEWISPDPDQEGPYAVFRDPHATCGQCGSLTSGWSVVDLQTATACSTTWSHDNGEVDAAEHAGMLNAAWLKGYTAREALS
jgi:hypothetical protein